MTVNAESFRQRFDLVSVNFYQHDAEAGALEGCYFGLDSCALYVLGGSGEALVSGEKIELLPDRFLFIPPMSQFYWLSSPDKPLEIVHIRFRLYLSHDMVFSNLYVVPSVNMTLRPLHKASSLRQYARIWGNACELVRAKVCAGIHKLLMSDLLCCARRSATPVGADKLMFYLRQLIELRAQQPFDGEELAKMVNLSQSQMNRRFRAAFDMSARSYHDSIRLQSVQSALLESELLIKEISFLFRFGDQFHFSRWFVKKTGVSPSTFRANGRRSLPTETDLVGDN